jgi:hypothetical protein
MDVSALRIRAATEAAELGPEPGHRRDPEIWQMERRAAVLLLADLADRNGGLLKRAALSVASEWTNRDASRLLLDAAAECR